MLELLFSLFFLTFLEIILGVDNIIFIALIVANLPKKMQRKARIIGLSLSLIMRLIFLAGIGILLRFSKPLFSIFEISFSLHSLIFIFGGIFLIVKSCFAMYDEVVGKRAEIAPKEVSYFSGIVQIIIVDFVFSIDSLITAIGITSNLFVIATAIIISILFMLAFSAYVSDFVQKHPTLKILAIGFILMIGGFLVLEGFSVHIDKGYIYFSVAFSLVIEYVNFLARKNREKNMN